MKITGDVPTESTTTTGVVPTERPHVMYLLKKYNKQRHYHVESTGLRNSLPNSLHGLYESNEPDSSKDKKATVNGTDTDKDQYNTSAHDMNIIAQMNLSQIDTDHDASEEPHSDNTQLQFTT